MPMRFSILVHIFSALLVLSTVALGQSPDPQPPKPQIEGAVVSALNGQLLPRALVVARNSKTRAQAGFTRADDNGHFLLERLDPGSYRISAGRQGYFSDDRKSTMHPVVELTAGAQVKDVLVRLMPLGVISGRIVDESNDPVRGVEVRLLSQDFYRGRQTLSTMGTAMSDDRGEYRIFDIRPGSYYLLAEFNLNKELNRSLAVVPARGGAMDIAYPPMLYPGTSDMPQAQKLAVNPGDELHADFALVPMQAVSIQGKVVNGLTNRPIPRPAVVAYWGENTAVMARTAEISETDNGFEIRGLGPGVYTLRTTFIDDNENFTDERVVEVTNQGIRNLLIAGLPDFEINGRVRVDADFVRNPWRVSVEFASVGPRVGSIFRVGTTYPTMQFTGKLHPGDHYKVNVPNLPQDFYLKSVRVAGHEMPNTDVVIGGRHTELDLFVSSAGGRIEGAAVNDNHEPVGGSYLLLVPDAEKINAETIRSVRADSKGKFVIRGVAPGTYKLFAFEDIELNDILNQPELLKNYESASQIVKVEESGKYTVEVKPLPAERAGGS